MAIKFSEKKDNQILETLGGYLKAFRIFKNITLEDVHAKTMIKIQFLDAIENDSLHELLDIRFARMHILNYARYIGANIDKTMNLYKEQYTPKEKKQHVSFAKLTKENAKKILIPKVFFKLTALVVIVVILFMIGLNLQKKGVLHRDLFEDKSIVLAAQDSTNVLGNDVKLEQTQLYSYKKEDFYKKYILKGKDVPWHVFPSYVKNR
ncbi:MAG: helix-turn-helix domain-containing protein [Candidatus Cloacimonetes bacterium]|nr:helix-turn-helix domain-containing protein [Candidatus Cloacimonadota bacterium]